MMAGVTKSLLRCGLLLFRLGPNRRQPNDSGAVHDVAVGIEARAVTGTIPRFLGLVPVDNAVEVRADRGAGVNRSFLVPIDGDLSSPSPDDRAFTSRDLSVVIDVALREVILVLLRNVRVLADVLGGRP